jgi:membrane protein YdbS with pleckstrin-like domain
MLSIYHLPNHIENEVVIKIVRRDVFILLKKVMMLILLLVLPLIFFYFAVTAMPGLLTGMISYPLIVLGTSAYYLFAWMFFFFSFIDYYLDFWIITNERIINIEQKGFFSRVIAEQRLFRIQDVASAVHGAIPTLLKYGNVHVQTAGAEQRFEFKEVPDPDGIRNMIIKLADENKARHPNLS